MVVASRCASNRSSYRCPVLSSPSVIYTALEGVLTGLGRVFLEGKNANEAFTYSIADTQKTSTCKDADTENEDDEFPSVLAMDEYDSDYESTSESDLEDEVDVEWLAMVASSRLEPRQFAKVYRPLQWLFEAHHFQSTRWTVVPVEISKPNAVWRTHLLAGVSPSRCVVGGVFLRARAF